MIFRFGERRIAWRFFLIPFLAWVLGVAGLVSCRQSVQPRASDPSVKITLETAGDSPVMTRPTDLVIRLVDERGAAVSGATIEVRGDMAHAGMIPVIVTATPTGTPGEHAARIEWTMAGDWVLTVTARLADGHTVAREYPLAVGLK